MKPIRSGFSLIELLVSIGIVCVLAAVSAAGLPRVLESSRATKCLANLRQIGAAALLCAGDNDGRLPMSAHQSDSWVGSLTNYLEGTKLFLCPSYPNKVRLYSYAINDFLTPNPYGAEELDYSRLSVLPTASTTLLMAECNEKYAASDHFHFADGDVGYSAAAFAAQVAVQRHGASANYLFADGHVASLTWTSVKAELQKPGSRFIRP